MYRCENCRSVFEEPKVIHTTYESYYGVSDLFENLTRLDLHVCPNCEDTDFLELKQCDECGEYFAELIDDDNKSICDTCFTEYEENGTN